MALFLAGLAVAVAGPIVREPGVIYLSDFNQKPPRYRLVAPAPCYFEATMKRYAGT